MAERPPKPPARRSRPAPRPAASAPPAIPAASIHPPAAPRLFSGPNRRFFLALLLLGAVCLAYQPVWRAGYLWDDDALLTHNPCLVGPLGLLQIWTTRAADICPLTITALWAEHRLWGLSPLPYHLLNVSLHAACALLLWRVLRRLRVPGAWLGAALWALHPVQVASVAWISEQKNTLSGVFYLLTILCFLRSLEPVPGGSQPPGSLPGGWRPPGGLNLLRRSRLAVSSAGLRAPALTVLCAALALTAKSSTLVLPAVLGLVAWWVEGRLHKRTLLKLAPILLLAVAAGLWSLWLQALHPATTLPALPPRPWPARFALVGDTVWFYLGKLAWPHGLMAVYPRWHLHPASWHAWLPLLALLALAAVLCLLTVPKTSAWPLPGGWRPPGGLTLRRSRPTASASPDDSENYRPPRAWFNGVLFAFACFLAALFPVLGLAEISFFRYSFVADHFLYLAGMGPLALAGAGLARLAARFPARTFWLPALPAAVLLLVLGAATRGRAVDYGSQELLWTEDLAKDPRSWIANGNLGVALAEEGRLAPAVARYRAALALGPDDAKTHNNLGGALLRQGRPDEALAEYRAAIHADPADASGYYNVGNVLLQRGETDAAIVQFQSALRLDGHSVAARANLGAAYKAKGQLDAAVAQYEAALRVAPGNVQNLNNLGNLFFQQGKIDRATEQYQEALRVAPTDPYTYRNLGNLFSSRGRLDDAAAQYREALRLDPADAETRNNLGSVLLQKGQVDDALAQYRQAVQLRPGSAPARRNLALALRRQGRFDEAAAQLREALRLQPDFPEARRELASLQPRLPLSPALPP